MAKRKTTVKKTTPETKKPATRLVDIEVESEEVSSKGLGDTVEKVLKKTGIDKVAKKVLGDDCGCKQRKEWLNKAFPYVMLKKGTMNDDQVSKWKEFKVEEKNTLNNEDQEFIISLYNSVFQTNIEPCIGCGNAKTWQTYIVRLNNIVNNKIN